MNLEEFATLAGVSITECDRSWGGRVAYTLKDHQNTTYCGFRSKDAAYKGWLIETFDKGIALAVLKLLKQSNA